MTTIAYKDGIMASDTQTSFGSFIRKDLVEKVYRTKSGLIGISGNAAEQVSPAEIENEDSLMAFLNKQKEQRLDTAVIYVDTSNTLLVYYGYSTSEDGEWCTGFQRNRLTKGRGIAIGTGCTAAEAAMLCGKSAVEAVKIASMVDTATGGKIRQYKL